MRIDIGSGGLPLIAPASSPSDVATAVADGAGVAEGEADVAAIPEEPEPGGTLTVVEFAGSSFAQAAMGKARGT
jgi:hypothetical protein